MIGYLDRPTHREALAALEAALDRGALTTLFGRCTVEYDGRASSTLGPGDRLVVLKPDGTALVHTDADRTPVNWQPPGTTHAASVREDRLRVVVERSSPDERLLVSFGTVAHLAAMDASDPHDIELRGRKAAWRSTLQLINQGMGDPVWPTRTGTSNGCANGSRRATRSSRRTASC